MEIRMVPAFQMLPDGLALHLKATSAVWQLLQDEILGEGMALTRGLCL